MLLTSLPNQLIGNRWLTLARNGTLAAAEERAAAMSLGTAAEYTALLAAGDPGRAARSPGAEPAQFSSRSWSPWSRTFGITLSRAARSARSAQFSFGRRGCRRRRTAS